MSADKPNNKASRSSKESVPCLQIQYPEYFNFAFDVMDRRADEHRDRTALLWADEHGAERRFTYPDVKAASNRIANFLQGQGIKKGDRVLIMLPRIPEWWFIMLGLMKVTAVSVPSAISLGPRDIEYRCNRAGIRMIITDAAGAEKVESIRERIPAVEKLVVLGEKRAGWTHFEEFAESASTDFVPIPAEKHTRITDPMVLYFTSGTTGSPKIVQHDHSYPLAHRLTAELWHDVKSTDVVWAITDTGWAKIAWGAFFGQWYAGAAVFIFQYGKFKGDRILSMLEKYAVTVFCAPPTAYRMLILEDLKKYDLSKLRRSLSAGEPLNPEVIHLWKRDVGRDLYEGYGQTETVLLAAVQPGMNPKPGSMGRPIPCFDVQILDADLHPAPVGQEGDIAVRVAPEHPYGVFRGYVNDDDLNREVFRNGWYLTGDRAWKDEDGYLWFVGRGDDIIKSSGYRIGPFEVESALIEHPAVAEAAVVGVADPMRGHRVKAFVILAPRYSPSDHLVRELQKYVAHLIAPFKAPKEIEFVEKLPKTISGKIRRVELREREAQKKLD